MATITAAVNPAIPQSSSRLQCRWIVGRGVDLAFVIGAAGAGYLYLLLYTAFQIPISYLWWFWSVGFDGTHIFGTASRTFFDREARRSNRWLLFGSAVFFFSVGPVMVLLGAKGPLALLVGIWAYYHVLRQHYGFMVLYKVKNRDFRPLDNFLDRWFLGVMMIFPPFHRFFLHHPEELGIKAAVVPGESYLWVVISLTLALYCIRQAWRLHAGDAVNVPKFLLLGGIIPLHWLTFQYLSWQAAVPTVTIVHNLQYHALIWFHNRNRYVSGDAPARHGRVPAAVARSLMAYAAAALLFSAIYRIPGFQLGRVSSLAFGFFCGFGLTHYYLDSRIWRVRHDPQLRTTLRLA